MTSKWNIVSGEQADSLLEAFANSIDCSVGIFCPLCEKELLRFYIHDWPARGKTKTVRSSIWVWCRNCYQYASNTYTKIATNTALKYHDPMADMSPDQISEKANGDLIELLNKMWETDQIPHTLSTA